MCHFNLNHSVPILWFNLSDFQKEEMNHKLKGHSHIVCGRLAETCINVCIFYLIARALKQQSYMDMLRLTLQRWSELLIEWVIFGSKNIFFNAIINEILQHTIMIMHCLKKKSQNMLCISVLIYVIKSGC